MAKKCLVTGATGFNGHHMVSLLCENGYDVRATDIANRDPEHWKGLDVEFIEADMTKKETLKPVLKGIEWVFNPASVFDYLAPWDLLESVNVHGTRNLVEACMDEGVQRFILWGTVGIYGPLIPELLPCKEDHPKNPSNNYEKSKWIQEEMVMEYYEKEKFPVTTIRPAPVYGPRNVYGIAQLVTAISRGWLGVYVTNYGNRLPFVNVTDVVRCALFVAPKEETIGEVYNIIDDSHHTSADMFTHIAKLTGAHLTPLWVWPPLYETFIRMAYKLFYGRAEKLRDRKKRPLFDPDTLLYGINDYWFSNEKIKKLGFKLTYPDVKTGIVTAVEWLRKEEII